MTPCDLDRRMRAVLPPLAAAALRLARQFDHSVDPAAAWLAVHDRPAATPDTLARALRAQARRGRRQGGAHGPSCFSSLSDLDQQGAGDEDPADLLAAAQDITRTRRGAGLDAALAEREPAADSLALAQREGITRRRAQQVLQARLHAEQQGQGVLL